MSTRKRIVITGVGRGLGRAMAAEFAARGHLVLGCSQSPNTVAALTREFPLPHRFDVVDVRDDAQVRAWSESVLASGEPPDLLINNAGVINHTRNLWDVEPQEFERVIDVNIKGVYYVIRHFVPAMIKRGQGVIVNFSSGWGRSVAPEVAPYCASKFAVEGLTLALADELPYGMAAVPLNPGIINTDMLRSCWGNSAASYPSPEEWAERAVPMLLRLGPDDNGESLSVTE
ncbi:MAG TPA: SDR family oxidoreductase [Pirellulaceae bacterium]|nr:SDR family oxidoreductase [Pirellulaceae bacterium]